MAFFKGRNTDFVSFIIAILIGSLLITFLSSEVDSESIKIKQLTQDVPAAMISSTGNNEVSSNSATTSSSSLLEANMTTNTKINTNTTTPNDANGSLTTIIPEEIQDRRHAPS